MKKQTASRQAISALDCAASRFQFFRGLRSRNLKAAFLNLAKKSEYIKKWVDCSTLLLEYSSNVSAIAQALNVSDPRDFFDKAKQISL